MKEHRGILALLMEKLGLMGPGGTTTARPGSMPQGLVGGLLSTLDAPPVANRQGAFGRGRAMPMRRQQPMPQPMPMSSAKPRATMPPAYRPTPAPRTSPKAEPC